MHAHDKRTATRRDASQPGSTHGALADALNGASAVRAQLALRSALDAPVQRVVQRMLEAGEVIPKIAEIAETYGLYTWNGGEFITTGDLKDSETVDAVNEAHLHLYKKDLEVDEDEVVLKGHAVWAKDFKTSKSNRRYFTITAKNNNGYWSAKITDTADDYATGDSSKNPDTKKEVLGMLDQLPDMLADALNE